VLDAIVIERRGIAAVPVGTQKLVETTGRAMARMQGVPDFPIAVVPWAMGSMDNISSADDVRALAELAVRQVEHIFVSPVA
jgi:hypothetical protein